MISALLGQGNRSVTVLPSAVRAATALSAVFANATGGGILVLLNVTASPAGGRTLAVNLYSDDVAHVTVAQLAAQAYGASTQGVLIVVPGAPTNWAGPTLSTVRQTAPPGRYSVEVVPSDGANWTYQVDVLELVL